ncbi:MAG: hypothetical protein LBC72_03570 [Spirochaetaceae bacterium]|jgi:hypothetical protein|nr:hypothetical protein [Spirochaetaceae bacterium]
MSEDPRAGSPPSWFFQFEHGGVLKTGFDTGLLPAAFARMRQTTLLEERGCIVYDGGEAGRVVRTEWWQAEGLVERRGRMVVFGPVFAGRALDALLEEPAAAALSALERWYRFHLHALGNGVEPIPGAESLQAAGVLLDEQALFFPPAGVVRAARRALGDAAYLNSVVRWIHPGLSGGAALHFSAAAYLYAVYAGCAPFCVRPPERGADSEALLHADMRFGVFEPLAFAAAGIDRQAAQAIDGALYQRGGKAAGQSRGGCLAGSPLDGDAPPPFAAEVFHAARRELSAAEREQHRRTRRAYLRTQGSRVRARRFFAAHTGTCAVCAVLALVVLAFTALAAWGRQAGDMLKGLPPEEVARAYYEAFAALDTARMEACLAARPDAAIQDDVNISTNLHVINKTRQLYGDAALDGFAVTVTELFSAPSDNGVAGGFVVYVRYVLSIPDAAEASLPRPVRRFDTLLLVRQKNGYRIAGIARQ